jgi:hypothetical protein
MKRKYIFSSTHQTTKVKFYDCNIDNLKTLLVEVDIDKIAENSYSLNYHEYLEDEKKEYNDKISIKKLGDICNFLPKSKRPASYGKSQGKYNFYTSSQTCNKYCDIFDYEDKCIIIGTGGNANIKYDKKILIFIILCNLKEIF